MIKPKPKVRTRYSFPLEIAHITRNANDAIVLRCIALWLKTASRKNRTEPWCRRTVKQLSNDLPFLKRTTIFDCIARLEANPRIKLVVDRSGDRNNRSYDRTLWFKLNEECRNIGADKRDQISFEAADAARYGVCAAVLLSNLAYQELVFVDREPEADGFIYHSMSPSYLAEYFQCFSRKTIIRKLNELVAAGEIIKHPTKTSYYRLCSGRSFLPPVPIPNEVVSKPNESVTNPDNNIIYKVDHNEDGKENSRGADIASPPAAQSTLPNASLPTGVKRLMELVEQDQKLRKGVDSTTIPNSAMKEFLDNPDLSWEDNDSEPRDWVGDDLPGEIRDQIFHKRNVVAIDNELMHIKRTFECHRLPITKADCNKILKLLADNRHLEAADIVDLLDECILYQEGFHHLGSFCPHKFEVIETVAPNAKFDPLLIVKKVRSAKFFLKNLPMIIEQLKLGEEEPYCSIDFSYNGRPIRNNIVQQDYV